MKEEEKPSESEDSSTEEEAVQRIGEVPHERQWPGVRRKAKSSHSVHHVARVTEKFERKGFSAFKCKSTAIQYQMDKRCKYNISILLT